MARVRTTSNERKTSSLQVLENNVVPTVMLDDRALTMFFGIIKGRERSTWTELDIHMASQLALVLQQIDELQAELVSGMGWFIEDKNGNQKRSPAAEQLDKMFAHQQRFITLLGLSAAGRNISGSDQAKRNEREIKGQVAAAILEDDDLLA